MLTDTAGVEYFHLTPAPFAQCTHLTIRKHTMSFVSSIQFSKTSSIHWNRFRATLTKMGFVVVMTAILLVYAPPVGLALVGLSLLFARADRKKRRAGDVTISTCDRGGYAHESLRAQIRLKPFLSPQEAARWDGF